MTPRKLGFLLSASLALLSTSTLAGTLAVRDVAALLSPQDIQALQTKAATLPFDVHLLIEKAGSKAALEDHAHAWVDGPKVVVVGLDPAGHHVVARFGVQTGVKTGDFDTVTLAGNTHFRAGEFVPGIEAIWTRARASAEAKAAITTQAAPVIVQEGLSAGTWAGIGFLVAFTASLALWLWRKRREDQERFERVLRETQEEASELRAENIRNMTRPAPSPARPSPASLPTPPPATSSPRLSVSPAPAYTPRAAPVIVTQPVVVTPSSSNDLLTGMVIGEAMASPRHVEHHHHYEPAPRSYEPAPSYTPPSRSSGGSSSSYSGSSSSYSSPSSSSSSSYDSGGSSSSYDSGSSSSYDSGSSSSSYDSGGGGGDW